MNATFYLMWLAAGLLAAAWYVWFASKGHAGQGAMIG